MYALHVFFTYFFFFYGSIEKMKWKKKSEINEINEN